MNTINVAKLHQELMAAGIPIAGVSSDGQIDFLPTVTETQRALADEILQKHDPIDYEAQRRAEYPSVQDQLDALWAGGEKAAEMKAKIEAINAKHHPPKK